MELYPCLTINMLGKISADDILKYFSYSSHKMGFDMSCKLSPWEKLSNPIFWEKNKKKSH